MGSVLRVLPTLLKVFCAKFIGETNYYTLVYRFIKRIRILKVLRTFGGVSTLVEVLESVQLGFNLISTSLFEPHI